MRPRGHHLADLPGFVHDLEHEPRHHDAQKRRTRLGGQRFGELSLADTALSDLIGGRWPEIAGFSWWNETWRNDDDRTHDTNMRVQDIPGAADLFRARLASPLIVDRPIPAGGPDPDRLAR